MEERRVAAAQVMAPLVGAEEVEPKATMLVAVASAAVVAPKRAAMAVTVEVSMEDKRVVAPWVEVARVEAVKDQVRVPPRVVAAAAAARAAAARAAAARAAAARAAAAWVAGERLAVAKVSAVQVAAAATVAAL